jgi:type VI secretion system protein ImpH
MGTATGRETDALTFFAALAAAPYRYDFYQTLRRIECLHDDKPRWGRALRPIDEPVRLGQDPDLAFAPSPLASFEARDGRPPRLQVRLFGLFGPNGPLPIHLTEYAHERLHHAGDPTLSRFLDIFHHRFLAMFYRAWAQAQPSVNHDRPRDDRFTVYVGSFLGVAPASFRGRDALPDLARLFHVGVLIRQVRNVEGLVHILEHFFRVPVRVEEFVGHWLSLGGGERTFLSADRAALGSGAVLGRRVWDRQHKFRIHLGPLTLDQYESFLPGGAPLKKLVDWVRTYLCYELDWDVRLLLQRDEVPLLTLGGGKRLGWTTWLGRRRQTTPADDLHLDPEAFVANGARAA